MLSLVLAALSSKCLTPPALVTTVHSLSVQVVGQGPSVILIPGLMCGGDVWSGTVDHLKSRYTCHVLTLPGFAGVPAIKPPLLSTVRDEIEAYVTENKLDRPVLIGHSLGGMLALWLASDKPSMFGEVVSVDGVPYIGGLSDPKQTPASLQQAITTFRNYYKTMDADRLAKANATSLPQLMIDPANVTKVAVGANKSDPQSIGEAISEMFETDLRPQMAQITVPLLLLVPDGNGKASPTAETLKARYEAQIAGVSQRQVVIVPHSLHFVMLDASKFFYDHLDDFLMRATR